MVSLQEFGYGARSNALSAVVRSISADESVAAATDFLPNHVGNHLLAGSPHRRVLAVRA